MGPLSLLARLRAAPPWAKVLAPGLLALTGPDILNSVWSLIMGFLSIIMQGLGQAFSAIFGAFGQGVAEMFQGWGFALGSYGVWGPLMVVVSLAVAAFVAYLFMDAIGIEKDIAGGEAEL